jgi:hypothetical protein
MLVISSSSSSSSLLKIRLTYPFRLSITAIFNQCASADLWDARCAEGSLREKVEKKGE